MSQTTDFFAPQAFEADVIDCQIEGTIPAGLNGAFIRVGGDWAYPPKHRDDSLFNQDGYVSRFRFRNGRVDYKGRWIETERYRNNRAAGRQLYGYYRNPHDCEPQVAHVDEPWRNTVANTSVEAHAGRLFALKEDARPVEIDPVTLETRGFHDFGGGYNSQTFTAHPKIDPQTGELLTFGYEATGLATDDLFYYVIDRKGAVSREVRLKVPYVSMVHDWAITQSHVIFPVFGYVTSEERLRSGQIHWAWDSNAPTWFGILPRDGEAKDLRWFKGPNRAIVHTFNARTEGGKVILEAPIFDTNPFPFFPFADGSKWDPVKSQSLIRRLTFDLASKDDGYVEEILFPGLPVIDLGRVDERFMGQDMRYAYTSFNDGSKALDRDRVGTGIRRITNSYGVFDMKDRTMRSFYAGPTHALQEVTFVPRHADAEEGDGWLIGTANNYADMRTELVVVDASHPEDGALGRVILPFRSNVQVHGRWYSDEQLNFGREA
ncbi:carotenoid oxygenase family protein [Sphingobium sp.]|uniref:carotenoid oxygenase family protein n=1 Tax=Sphingobium sp. TaxID=1912891 RepID=UPI0028BEF6B7|nr:carotenoid oxygenase family protein [Sphingobium sp.]